ncbi:MAG TPA: YhdP family protein [Steroidobacteraceae bacterium]|nr:YhdP family protein [Steroidobacteraceae bacterium]
MRTRLRKLIKWLLGLAVATVVLLGLTFAAFGVVVSRVPEYRVQLQNWINERSGLSVEFKTLSARLRLYGPELIFDQAVVRTGDGARVLATARRGSVGFDLWSSIRNARLTAGRFVLESPEIGLIRTQEGRIQLLGQSALPERDKPFALEELPTGRFHVRNAVVSFRDAITGRGPWSLSGVNFDVTRNSSLLELHGDASLPRTLGRELRFSATVEGPLQDATALVSSFSVDGRDLDLAGWADVLPDEWPAPETGRGNVEVRGALKGAKLIQLAADVDLEQLVAVPPMWATALPVAEPRDAGADNDAERKEPASTPIPETDPGSAASATHSELLSYPRLAFGMRAQKVNDTWRVAVSNLNMARPTAAWLAARIEGEWTRTADGHTKASGQTDRIVLDALWPLLAYLPESEAAARLRALDASGTLSSVSVEFERDSPTSAPKYSVRAHVDDLGFAPVQRAPGAAGLSGALQMTEAGGELKIAAQDVQFELPRMFREPLAAQTVDASVRWHKSDQAWTIESNDVRMSSADGQATARFVATIPGDGSSPVLDLAAQGSDLKVSSTHKYIPAGRLGAKTMEWFDRAFLGGRVTAAEFTYRGSVRDFPFRKNEGLFLVRGHVEDGLFDYQPGWIPASDVTADVEFRNQGMHIHATAANVGGLRVTEATADIPDLKETHLRIKAAARGELQDGLELLTNSPLAPALGATFARLSGRGAVNAAVDLDLPIRNLDKRRIEVQARFADATVAMRDVDAPVRSLQGSLTVRNTLVAAADLHGQWLGGPLDVVIQPDGNDAAVLNATGTATAAQLKPFLPSAVKLSGSTQWRLATEFHNDEGQDSERKTGVRIESNLRGLGIALPDPVGKSADAERPFQVTLEADEDAVLARSWLGDVRAIVRVARTDGAWGLDRGGIRADGNAPALPSHRGLRIEGAVDHFVLDDWLALRGDGGDSGTGKPLSDYLQAANVRVGTFDFGGYRWSDVRGMLQATTAGWRVDVDGPGAAGQILIPEQFTGSQTLRATLERLVLDKPESSGSGETEKDSSDPRSIPNLHVHVADLRFGTRELGTLDLKASRQPQGIRFDSATIDGASAHAQGQGEWMVTPEGQSSSLKATITSEDVAATLRALGYGGVIEAKHGELSGDVKWNGGFDLDQLAHANGTINVRAETGQLLAVQPGAGRVLGLFSVAALPRRLGLDFKDLTDKGLAFDSVHGDFELRDGNAYTSNLLLRGPAAEIGIAGRTGLATRDYDQTAIVTGNLGASPALAGALAGGPVVGAAVLLFSQVFKEPLKGITRGYYRITGPWDNPTVERVDASAIKVSEQQGPPEGK